MEGGFSRNGKKFNFAGSSILLVPGTSLGTGVRAVREMTREASGHKLLYGAY